MGEHHLQGVFKRAMARHGEIYFDMSTTGFALLSRGFIIFKLNFLIPKRICIRNYLQ